MLNLHRIIASLLVLVQAFTAAGLGPRAVCRDPDGSTCVDSVLSPCCCHRHQETLCCAEDNCDETGPADVGRPQIASGCQCQCTPVAAQPVMVHRIDVKASLDHVNGLGDLLIAATFPIVGWTTALPGRPGPLRTGPPPHPALVHLDSVILRL